MELDQKLEQYSKSDYYPFHMPGHKRRMEWDINPYEIDITEIEGFDNLHHPTEILKEAEERAADLYHAKQSFYLINGSTSGILTAISSAVSFGGTLLMARNVHKSVYHAVYLRHLKTEYLHPKLTSSGLQGEIMAWEVELQLKRNPHIEAVMITSPTYEGIVSNISEIAKICHRYQVPLIVDEAHGAHFGFHEYFPESAITQGADLIIQSMHKLLPSLTQTALLHINDESYVDVKKVKFFLGVYQTSSPSYLLMAGMERCIRLLKEKKEKLFSEYVDKLCRFYQEMEQLSMIEILTEKNMDRSKIVISVKDTNMSGQELYETLLQRYHLQMEMASGSYVLAMSSIMDTEDGFLRLQHALMEIDGTLHRQEKTDTNHFIEEFYAEHEKKIEIYEALEQSGVVVGLEDAVGKISRDTIFLYPPGIPVLLPGEFIEEATAAKIRKAMALGLNIQGNSELQNGKIEIVN